MNLREQLAELLDRAEAEGSKVVAIQAVRRLLDPTTALENSPTGHGECRQ